MISLERRDWSICAALFVFVSSVYFATFVGVTSSNDGSHYALVRALVESRSFEISEYLSFTEFQDYSLNGDLRFSDRPPGTAFFAAPFYAFSRFFPEPVVVLPSKHDLGQPALLGVGAATAVAAAAAVALLYSLLRKYFAIRNFGAVMTALALAFGTVMWKYGSVLYSHSVNALLVMVVLTLVVHILRAPNQHARYWFLLGLSIGATVLVEYTNFVLALFLGIFLMVFIFRNVSETERIRAILALGMGTLISAGILLAYNALNFGGPFELSTFNVDTTIWPQNENFGTDFATPLLVGLQGMLFWGSESQGLFVMAPFALLGLPGWLFLWKRSPRDLLLFGGLFVIMLFLFSKSTTFNSLTNDARYQTPFLSLWFLPVALSLDSLFAQPRRGMVQMGWFFLVFGLLFLSVRNVFWHIALSWNYDLDVSQLVPASVHADNLKYLLSTVFPNAANVWWLWWLQGLAFVIGWGAWKLRRAT